MAQSYWKVSLGKCIDFKAGHGGPVAPPRSPTLSSSSTPTHKGTLFSATTTPRKTWFGPMESWISVTFFKYRTFWSSVYKCQESKTTRYWDFLPVADTADDLLSSEDGQSKSSMLKVCGKHSSLHWSKPRLSRCCGCWEKCTFVGGVQKALLEVGDARWRCRFAVTCLKSDFDWEDKFLN